MKTFFRKLLRPFEYLLVLIFILFEELVWERLAEPLYEAIRNLRLLQRLEGAVLRINRYLILLLFVALFVSVELAGVTAGVLIVQGMVLPGLLLYALKIPIAAFTFWLFGVSRPKLLSFAWFRWSYEKLLAFLEWIKTRTIYRETMRRLQEIKAGLRSAREAIKGFFSGGNGRWKRRIVRLYERIKAALHRDR